MIMHATNGMAKGRYRGEAREVDVAVGVMWDELDPLVVNLVFANGDEKIAMTYKYPREMMIDSMAAGPQEEAGTRSQCWSDGNNVTFFVTANQAGTPLLLAMDRRLILRVLDAAESDCPGSGEREQAIIDNAVEQLLVRVRGWKL